MKTIIRNCQAHFFEIQNTCIYFVLGPFVLSRLVDHDPADMKAYNIRSDNSPSYIREALKSLRDMATEKFIIMCSSVNTDIVLTQVCTIIEVY